MSLAPFVRAGTLLALLLGSSTWAQSAMSRIQTPPPHWAVADWTELPNLSNDDLAQAWNAWLRGCHRPTGMPVVFARLCPQIRMLSLSDHVEKLTWLQRQFLPYRVLASTTGLEATGLLTGYYEPILDAKRSPDASFRYPLYAPPSGLNEKSVWFSRQEIESSESVRALLRGREIAYLDNPIDVLVIQIQGSARLRLIDTDIPQLVRVAYADSNRHPYQSIGKTLLEQRLLTDASWSGIKSWLNTTLLSQPDLAQQVLWRNPRYVFFRTVTNATASSDGPQGGMGVPLTEGRSVAVDPRLTPYGTPLWVQSTGEYPVNRLVFAQDTGAAITGQARLDLFLGSGAEAGAVAGKLKQTLTLWALWPRTSD